MAKKATLEQVEIRYDLFDLPTAQHKAGLAGLVLAIRSLKERSEKDPEAIPPETVPEIIEGPDNISVTVRFTERSLKGLFDDLYDADLVKSEPREKPRTKGKGASKTVIPPVERALMRLVDKTGKEKEVEGYVYLDVTPRLAALSPLLPPTPLWLKLWRNVLFQAIRDGRKQAPYKKRAAERFKNGPLADAIVGSEEEADSPDDVSGGGEESNWGGFAKERQEKLSSALYIGAQGVNAEQIAFTGSVRSNLLLHFWPLSMLVFVPSFIDSDGKEHLGKRGEKDKSSHYVVALPEVSALRRFCELYPRMLSRLGEEKRGYRPARAVIMVAAQGSLEFINHIAQLAEQTAAGLLSRGLNGVEFYHLMKPDPTKGAVLVGSGRVLDNPDLIDGYRDIVGRPGEPAPYRNPLFKGALILALLRGKPWWGELLPLFTTREWRFFVFASDTRKEAPDIAKLSWFSADAARKFDVEIKKYQQTLEVRCNMSTTAEEPPHTPEPPLPMLIHRLVRSYVMTKAKLKCGYDKKKKLKDLSADEKKKVYETKSKIASDAFLSVRSRHDQDFVDYFTSTICSVGQYFDRANREREFQIVADALLKPEKRVDVKTLTLLALSANS